MSRHCEWNELRWGKRRREKWWGLNGSSMTIHKWIRNFCTKTLFKYHRYKLNIRRNEKIEERKLFLPFRSQMKLHFSAEVCGWKLEGVSRSTSNLMALNNAKVCQYLLAILASGLKQTIAVTTAVLSTVFSFCRALGFELTFWGYVKFCLHPQNFIIASSTHLSSDKRKQGRMEENSPRFVLCANGRKRGLLWFVSK